MLKQRKAQCNGNGRRPDSIAGHTRLDGNISEHQGAVSSIGANSAYQGVWNHLSEHYGENIVCIRVRQIGRGGNAHGKDRQLGDTYNQSGQHHRNGGSGQRGFFPCHAE